MPSKKRYKVELTGLQIERIKWMTGSIEIFEDGSSKKSKSILEGCQNIRETLERQQKTIDARRKRKL